jgi:hypothetical protein
MSHSLDETVDGPHVPYESSARNRSGVVGNTHNSKPMAIRYRALSHGLVDSISCV